MPIVAVADKPTLDKIYNMLNKDHVKRYGIRINKNDSNPNTRIEYIYDAVGMTPAYMDYTSGNFNYGSWGDVWFVKDNRPVMLKSNGTVAYELNHNNQNFKLDGVTASDVANSAFAGNAMSEIPLVWLCQYEDANYEYVIACNVQYDESYQAYAHMRADGSIMSAKYMRMYKGTLDASNKLRSLSGLQPMLSKTATNEITYATANGTLWNTTAWNDRNLIESLLKIISKNDDSQAKFGNGNLNYDVNQTPTNGVMLTGALADKGQFIGYNDNIHQVKVFYMEGWWADQWERIAGCINDNGDVKVKSYPPYNLTGDGYVSVGVMPSGTSGGYVSKTKMTQFGRIPVQASGSSTTYTCDGLWFNNAILTYALAGGGCHYGSRCGASCLSLGTASTGALWAVGACLSCEQPL